MKIPYIPEDAPFNGEQKYWLAGFLAGLHSRLLVLEDKQSAPAAGANTQLHILFGSQTGNAEALSQTAAKAARAKGLVPVVQALGEVDLDVFATMRHVLIVTSTYGEGEMPDNAQLFWNAISASTAPRLEQMHFAVLAIGDTGYDGFCQAGKFIDMRLEQLGAKRVADRIDCDIDFEEPSSEWIGTAMPQFAASAGSSGNALESAPEAPVIPGSNKQNPYAAALATNKRLSAEESAKDIRHFEFDLTDSGLKYEAGDALGVIPVNDASLVSLLLTQLKADYETPVPGFDRNLGDLLTYQFEISEPSRKLIEWVGQNTTNQELRHVLQHDDKDTLAVWLWGKDTLDLLQLELTRSLSVPEFVAMLRPLQHRAYSISSSSKAHPNQVHLTIASVRYHSGGRERKGVCSTYLAERVRRGEKPAIFISPNKAFRVPSNGNAPLIMVGPGTGIAPFRAFLQERQATGAEGKNWLFFGDQHQAHDYIYEEELQAWQEKGLLTNLDLAFSRDQEEKIYVQNRMLEKGAELYAWLQDGAYFYVCGDASRMAKDVDAALYEVVRQFGGLSSERAAAYVDQLKKDKRYLRDVY
ncbi:MULTISPECIES: sulfite reductase subunit alpha [Pantoea]|jgi:sulfite reductase (NADPH) flavoprotein alpha-component|uniref:Sulfite reductase [NADPH] flavoprotein alpha-component n=2 Tax=Pantoea TaxID=53335 RepID=A0A1I3XDU5_9GAMM|nr:MULTISPECIES: sulfite reductase subunit alpha [Pantoea]MDY0927632.1 sulfite reductase subunit alpha [Enterobacter sp. CFBP8995]MRS20323.1 sulfite reductase subunit alpha [Enterobacteriaceae bacterium RIT692]MRT23796.1 sulfite reductase subunit alpha [Enterobacteriaceae bacterium RIT697]KAJ9434440.1 sulfite reductase subunit alpha [Pantoea sp. YR343]MCQ8226321.1 sulfite reductase subunit alpha [Pantoea sp. MMK2]